ncbi:hypothetical protein [Chelatococcus asaccharovorans]|uniref:hypothetical protein n=1 Tax=Chelatococcus asaccharovorans TaxID=28210 RepID=UPI00224C7A0B|nr:hypothetical protein [Chelatococcus asaccharovorans]CAH1662015.1 hypothetical protein CHELA17_50188 [Chelatococcus asaccharovorans]CAH1689301.1 hypothetical protein CHELA40_40006 [Chelatococcus asaccharovorans]
MTAGREKAVVRAGLLGWKSLSLMTALAFIVLLVAANAHLVYVAFVSQPDCVPHLKDVGESGEYRAARSSC